MFGGIALRGKLLATVSGGLTGEIRVFDLDSRSLQRRIPVAARAADRVEAGSIAIAADGSLWIADGSACLLRRFSAFGAELDPIGVLPSRSRPRDRRGLPAQARGVAFDGQGRLWVASGDRPRVHGLQRFSGEGRFELSVQAFGRRDGLFGPGYAVRVFGDRVWLADTGNDCLQQFRDDGGFVGSYELERRCRGARRPIDLAPHAGGFALLCLEPRARLFLLDSELDGGEPLLVDPKGLERPSGLVAAPGGGLFVADRDGERILELSAAGEPLGVAFS